MQGIHKEGEFRQLEIWTWKSYVRPPILHNSKQAETSQRIFIKYMMNIGANNYQRGHLVSTRHQGALGPPGMSGGLCSAQPTSGAPPFVFK